MMWNQNDTKYIIKRLILYAIISGIVFFGASRCAKAQVISTQIANGQNISSTNTQGAARISIPSCTGCGNGAFKSQGEGYVIFNLYIAPGQSPQDPITWVGVGNSTSKYMCETSGSTWYYDNSTQRLVNSYKCPVNISSEGLTYIEVYNREARTIYIQVSQFMTFVGNDSDASAIVNGINQAINNSTSQGQANTQQIVDSVNGMIYYANQNATQAHNDSQAETNAINSVNSSIQAQTNWQQQDFNVDTTQIDAVTDLISTGDKNKIRDLLMFPARILMLIGAHIGSDYCYAYNLGSLYGTNLILPCINWKNYVGATLYNTIDTIISIGIYIGLIIYIRKLLDYAFSLGATTFESVNVEVFK